MMSALTYTHTHKAGGKQRQAQSLCSKYGSQEATGQKCTYGDDTETNPDNDRFFKIK